MRLILAGALLAASVAISAADASALAPRALTGHRTAAKLVASKFLQTLPQATAGRKMCVGADDAGKPHQKYDFTDNHDGTCSGGYWYVPGLGFKGTIQIVRLGTPEF